MLSDIIAAKMTAEDVERKIEWLDRKMAASFRVWNFAECRGARHQLMLKSNPVDGKQPREYVIGKVLFRVLDLTVSGLSNGEIATLMGRSVQTIKNHQEDLFLKFDVGKRVSLITKLLEEGVLAFKPSIPEENWVGIRDSNS